MKNNWNTEVLYRRMKIHHYLRSELVLMAVMSFPLHSYANNEQDNVHFSGTLVADPCVVPPGEEEVVLNFGSVINKYLYANRRTHGQMFTLHLAECNPAIGATVKVRFIGQQNEALPGKLALDTGSSAAGVAIGLETLDGSPVALGELTSAQSVTEGEMHLQFQAYVEGEPEAIANKTIISGTFTATATFSLEYQ